jgi:hypothetical protein
MNLSPSLNEIISQQAVVFADQIKQAATFAVKEEEIRIEAEKALAFIQREVGIKLEGRHEFTIGTGRTDSVYDCVIIEYKNPASPDRLSAKSDAAGNKKVVEQLKKRFYDMRTEFGRPLNTMLGVGCDGNYFIFVRFRDDKWDVQPPVEVNRHSAERFLWALFNLGTKGKAFAPEYLAGDFGSDAKLAQDGIRALYETISTTTNPKAQTFFQQWKILFNEVCGYDVNSPSEKIKKLGEFYGIYCTPLFERGGGGIYGAPKPAELLFAVHTYYALFMKLLASEIVAFFHKLPTPLQKMMQAGTSNKLRREMEELEAGSIFRHLNITNFLEGDLFAWYPAAWCEPIEKLIRDMVAKLDGYNPGTLSEDPSGSRDLLKKLYQQLFPKSVRHDLGEYYTPDWLAEHVLNELEYTGDPDKRLLDPACGSGTFLVMAINRIRKWYDDNRERCPYNEGELCRKILQNIIGFDLNPLAVMAARTNYLIAIRDLLSYMDQVEIPVYLCDSIMTPAEYGGLTAGRLGDVKELQTSAARFLIPTEIATKRDDVAKYANLLESCVRDGYSPEEFIVRCRDESLPVTAETLHIDLYNELVKLDKENKNSVWARIIKNAFAPLFIEQVDYIAGNPPWVNWEHLPADYRDSIAPLWQEYDLFRHGGMRARLGGAKDDISVLMTYVAHDAYLKEGGRLGFVITQTVFKTKGGGEGFRSFTYQKNRKNVYLGVLSVHDMSDLQPFEGATNRTAVFICEKATVPFSYPVPYILWQKTKKGQIDQDETLEEVRTETLQSELGAIPVDRDNSTSPWLTVSKKALAGIQKAIGKSDYRAYEGVNTGGLNGCYWIRILKRLPNGELLVENLHDVGKKTVEHVQATIESDLVYPLLRGRDVQRWKAEPSTYIILANRTDKLAGIPESEMKREYPKTYAYFKRFEEQLWQRASSSVRQLMETGAFYSMFAVGSYTLAPWKVMWPEVGHEVQAGVCKPVSGEFDLPEHPPLPDHTIVAVSCKLGKPEAYFLAAVLNSSPARSIGLGYIALHPSPHVLTHIAAPKFNPNDTLHLRIANLSERCHDAKATGDEGTIAALESEIDKAATQLWGITDDELKAIQDALMEMAKPKRKSV